METSFPLYGDILYLIALYFKHDRRALRAFNLVSREFYYASAALLYRHIDGLSAEQRNLLEQNFENEPSLRNYVHSCSIELDRGVPQHDGLALALTYPNLKEVSIKSSDKSNQVENPRNESHWSRATRIGRLRLGRHFSKDFQCTFLDKHSFPRIPTVHLSGDLTTTEIMRFMLLPHIRSLHAKDLGILRTAFLPRPFASSRSNLTSLTLTGDGCWSINTQTMRSIFELCPLLRSLCCQIPVVTKLDARVASSSHVDQMVRPRNLIAMFEPVRSTLQHLSLLQLRDDIPYDESYMNFTRFTALKDLEITSCCLMGDRLRDIGRYRLCNLLPASLQHLKLDFPHDSGIFYRLDGNGPFRSQHRVVTPLTQWTWISNFLEEVSNRLPDLKSVTMHESTEGFGFWGCKGIKWTLPPRLEELARQLGVKLSIWLTHSSSIMNTELQVASEISSGN